MNFYIETFGCKVNQYDSQEIAEYMEQSGFNRTENSDNADIVIINSCTVTAESDRKARNAVRSYKKKNTEGLKPSVNSCLILVPEAGVEPARGVNLAGF